MITIYVKKKISSESVWFEKKYWNFQECYDEYNKKENYKRKKKRDEKGKTNLKLSLNI